MLLKSILYPGVGKIEWSVDMDKPVYPGSLLIREDGTHWKREDKSRFFVCMGAFVFLFSYFFFKNGAVYWKTGTYIEGHLLTGWQYYAVFQLPTTSPGLHAQVEIGQGLPKRG